MLLIKMQLHYIGIVFFSELTTGRKKRGKQAAVGGFSLIEVTFSLGIMAFVLVTLLGLIPVSLTTYTKSVDLTTQANIAQRLYTMVQQTPFSDTNFSGLSGDYYFDEEGFPAQEGNFVYNAKLSISSNATLVPSSSGGQANNEMRTLVIQIARGRKVELVTLDSQLQIFTYVVANTGI